MSSEALFFAISRECNVYRISIVPDYFEIALLNIRVSPGVPISPFYAKYISITKDGILVIYRATKNRRQLITDPIIELCSSEAIARRTAAGHLELDEIQQETAKVLELLRNTPDIIVPERWE